MMRMRRVTGMIIIAVIVLFILLDIFFFNLPRQNFLTHLIALVCLLFIERCFLSHPKE